MSRFVVVAYLAGLAASAAPQQRQQKTGAPAAASAAPIETIRIAGSKLYDEAAIRSITGLRVGDTLDEKRLEAARDNLLASGAFTNVSYRYEPALSQKGYALTFEVIDLDQLFEYRIERLEVDEAKLRAHLKQREPLFDRRIPGADAVLARLSAAIAGYLRSQNKPAEVVGRVAVDAGETFVLFSPPGALAAVATVDFTGNKALSLTQLRNAIHPVAVGSQYREVRFRELLDIGIRPMYESRGLLRVKFTSVAVKPADSVKGLAVTVGIDEGEKFSFGPVQVTGAPGAEEALLKTARLPEGEVADMQLVAAAQSRIERFMHANGHMAVQVAADRHLVDKERLCNITFKVTPGPQYTFGKLTFQGLDLHGEHEMKRIWTLKPGAPYNGEYPDTFINRVKEEQLFDGLENARAVATPNHEALTVDVKLVFNERKPKILQ